MSVEDTMSPLAVSMGDPSGIGPDVILAAWHARNDISLPKFAVVGDPVFLQKRAENLGLHVEIEVVTEAEPVPDNALPVIDFGHRVTGTTGEPTSRDAEATLSSITRSVAMCFDGSASGVITCPINKKVLYDAGFDHPGHTEFLAELALQSTGQSYRPVMMLAGPRLRTVPVTIHIPLSNVPQSLTTELVAETLEIVNHDLRERFGMAVPRIAVSGLNPHAGEQGAMGIEDDEIIRPAIAQMIKSGLDVVGPLPADTMFHPAARATYDVAVCMYHDQALIPAKALDFDDAVNVTLGLPFIRTSPDHGTAYDIAGSGKANPSSFVAALHMAHEMAKQGKVTA